ncbi:LysR substrate-binding domain-containing protein [Chamaesiphon sp. VAR_69_metabat_338]|uniref:LysR family transcriptional regulator n=1 Tax=Chamaesiphon sp. VAR_69_metabat_338 TaxID=2964704 RepID=UPI00286E19C7|nr:LysR substrate-binding domain-containing protein [Chamaesiphon sp. VAR_69_metabat_338]
MELRHLRYFRAVATELHFGRAAEKLHISQPPLTKQIQDLEAELGFDLFKRTKRSVVLTPAGQAFLSEVDRILQQLDRAIDIGSKTSRGELGQISIGFVGSATYNILPTILQQFRDRYPDVRIELHELTTDRQLIWLREGRIDIGLIRPPIVEPSFATQVIFQESLVVALPSDLHLAAASLVEPPDVGIDLAVLASEPFILFPRELAPGLYDPIITICQAAGFSPQVVQECIQMQTIVSLVSANMGVSILPASIQEAQRQGVVYRPIAGAVGAEKLATIAIVWRQQDDSPTMHRFLEMAIEKSV